MFKILYKTGKTEKEFSKLEFAEKTGKENDEISPFFQEHLKNIFPELIFVFKENRKETTRYKFSKRRELDAICWYPEGKYFIIFEYKSEKPRKIVEQISEYLDRFSAKNNEDCVNLFDNLKNSLSGGKEILRKNIEWEETRLIYISPEIPPPNSSISEISRIIWVKSEWYEKEKEAAVILKSEDKEGLLKQLSKKQKIENLSQLLQEIKVSKKEVKNWVEKFHGTVTKNFLLNIDYSPAAIFYKKNKTRLFWIWISKKSLKVYFSTRTEKFLVPLIKKYESLFQFKSYWNIKVKDEKSFSESIQIIEEFLIKQANKNE